MAFWRHASLEVGDRLPWWETPVLVVPLTTVGEDTHGGLEVSVVARVALSFTVNTSPQMLLRAAEEAELPLAGKVERVVDRLARWAQPFACSCRAEDLDCGELHGQMPQATRRPDAGAGRGSGVEAGAHASSANQPRRRRGVGAAGDPLDEPDADPSVPAAGDWTYKL